MKLIKTKNLYTNSTGSNQFNLTEMQATSFRWWVYFKRINGRNVFNWYAYSNCTSKHQRELFRLLQDLKIKIDIEVQIKDGLQGLKSIKEVRKAEKDWHKKRLENEERKRIERNKRSRELRRKKRIETIFAQEFVAVVFRKKWEFNCIEINLHTAVGIHRIIEDLHDQNEIDTLLGDAVKDNFPRVFIYN